MTEGRIKPLREGGAGLSCGCLNFALELAEILFRRADWIQLDFSWMVRQWGYRSDAVSASAATHNGGGVCDVAWSLVDTDRKLAMWFEAGIIPLPRNWIGNRHGHMLTYGCDHMDPSADDQIRSYLRGMDGLAVESRYPGPWRTPITWSAAREKYRPLLEDQMPEARDVWTVPIDESGHDAEWYLTSIRKSLVAIIGPRTQDIEDDTDGIAQLFAGLNANITGLRAEVKALAANLVQ